jgi:hypothetical protein
MVSDALAGTKNQLSIDCTNLFYSSDRLDKENISNTTGKLHLTLIQSEVIWSWLGRDYEAAYHVPTKRFGGKLFGIIRSHHHFFKNEL